MDTSNEKKWMCVRKGNRERENESLLTGALNNAIRTIHIKARTDTTQQTANIGTVAIKTKQSIT